MLLRQLSYNGLVIGPSTDIGITHLQGFRGLGDLRQSDVAVARADGFYPGVTFLGERTLTIGVVIAIADETARESAFQSLSTALWPIQQPGTLQAAGRLAFVLSPQWAYPRYVTARCIKGDIDLDVLSTLGVSEFDIEFVAADPLVYEDYLRSASIATDLPVHVEYSGSDIPNTGYSQPVITVVGPITNPVVNLDNDNGGTHTLAFSAALSWADVWTIDSKARTIVDQNGNSQYAALNPGSLWPTITPGGHTFSVTGTGFGSQQHTISWRKCWAWS